MSRLEQAKTAERMMLAELPWLAPIGALVVGAVVAVLLALALPRRRQGLVGAWVAVVHLAVAGLAAFVWLALGFRATMSGTLIVDGLSLTLTGVVGVVGALAVAVARPTVAGSDREGEFYAILTMANLAVVVLGSAADAALLALSLAALGLTNFILTGYLRRSRRGNEAALKFYVYGTVAGAAMIFGLTWWFGLAGSTSLAAVGRALPDAPVALAAGSTALVLVGLGYKAAVVPFHFWTPDVYEGAPLPVAAYLSVLPKIAGLVALARVLPLVLPNGALGWPTAIAVVAAATMLLGAIAAIPQRNVVRLLAYSSISQAGFILIGVAALAGSDQALPSLLYYAIAYAATNLAAFAVVFAVQRERRSVDLSAFGGLGQRHPWWTVALIVAFLSLLGLPPLSGFVAKLEVFRAAIDAGQAWLAIVGVAATVISLYPYLRVIAPTVLVRDDGDGPRWPAEIAPKPLALALALSTVAAIAIGVAAQPFLELVGEARAVTS